jgi:hypothetical protein
LSPLSLTVKRIKFKTTSLDNSLVTSLIHKSIHDKTSNLNKTVHCKQSVEIDKTESDNLNKSTTLLSLIFKQLAISYYFSGDPQRHWIFIFSKLSEQNSSDKKCLVYVNSMQLRPRIRPIGMETAENKTAVYNDKHKYVGCYEHYERSSFVGWLSYLYAIPHVHV